MTRYQRVTAGLRGMLIWLDHKLEQEIGDENLLNAKAVCKDALELLQAQQICLECFDEGEINNDEN